MIVDPDEIKKLASSLNAVASEKLKLQKVANKVIYLIIFISSYSLLYSNIYHRYNPMHSFTLFTIRLKLRKGKRRVAYRKKRIHFTKIQFMTNMMILCREFWTSLMLCYIVGNTTPEIFINNSFKRKKGVDD